MTALFPTYQRRSISFADGKGSYLYDQAGKKYLDFTSGIAVVNIGHNHPAVVQALQTQSERLWHTSNLFKVEGQEELAEALVKKSHLDAVFFCNSGAEANEAAIKLARKHTGKSKFISFSQSFHGRTFGAMAATGQEKIKLGYGPMLSGFVTVPYNDSEALLAAADDETAAIFLEVIQGEGGVFPAQQSFIQTITKMCVEKDILLIVDEVQTGMGRTGKRFAYEHFDLKPDIITVAKGLGNGYPIGAMIGKKELATSFGPGSHGTTFGGNPLAAAVGKAVVEVVFQEEFLQEVQEKGEWFIQELNKLLQEHYKVVQVRGKGLMIGMECSIPVSSIIEDLEAAGLLVVPAGATVIRFLPPLTVSYKELSKALQILTETL